MANLFKLGRSIITGAKNAGKSLVPPKKVKAPHMQNTKQKISNDKKIADNKAARERAFTKQIGLGAAAVGAGTVLSRRKPETTATPVTKTTPAPKAEPVVARKTLSEYYIPAAPKGKGLLSKAASSLKSKVSSSKKESKASSKPSTRKSNVRKSDSRLGAFSSRKRSSASREVSKDTMSTPRAAIDYSAPMWDGNTPTNMAIYGKVTQAPAPKVRTEVAEVPKVDTKSYRGKRSRSDKNTPVQEPKPQPTRKGRRNTSTSDTRGGSNVVKSVKDFYQKTYNLPSTTVEKETPKPKRKGRRNTSTSDTRGSSSVGKSIKNWYKKTYNL